MKRFTLYKLFHTALWAIAFLCTYFIFFLNFIYNASVSYDAYEKVSIDGFLLGGHLLLLLAAAIVLLLVFFKKHLIKVNPKLLFLVFSVMYIGMALYLILNIDHVIRADAGTVFRIAKQIADGDFSAFLKGGYIERYPHQAGLLFYDSILQLFSKGPWISFAANLCFVLGINFFIAKIADLLTQDREVILITVILSFSFLPQFFFILFAYGLTPGFFFMILGFYNAIRFSRLHKVHNAVFAVIGAAVAATFKQNFLIGVIAIVIFWLLDAMRLRGKDILKPVVASLALILCFSVPSFLVRMYFEEKSDVKLGEGTPTVLWLAMGTDIDNRYLGPGWYTGFNYATYTNSGYDTEEAARIGNERLKENLEEIKENPKEALTFFKDKTISQWCEPMFQSAWSGPLESCNQFTHTKLLQSIYNGEAAAERLAMFSKLVVLLIFGCTVLFLLSKKRDGFGWQVLLLFFIGGLLFQTVWEGKSQYIYPYVFSLIPTAAYGLKLVSDKTKTWIDVRSRKRIMENNE